MVEPGENQSPKWDESELETLNACPICGSNVSTVLHDKLTDGVFFCSSDTWTMHRCSNCEVAYLNPRSKQEFIGKAYTTYYTHDAVSDTTPEQPSSNFKERLRARIKNGYINRRYNVKIKPGIPFASMLISRLSLLRCNADRAMRMLRLPCSGARLLDVGCGNGDYLLSMRELGWEVAGLDFDQAAVDACARAGINVQTCTLEEAGYEDNSFDAITLSHVIEHLYDPISTLACCFRLLKPNGCLYLETPNINSEGHRHFGPCWRGLEPPRHLTLFTPASLQRACEKVGFEVKRVQGVPTYLWMYQQSSAIKRGVNPYDKDFWEPVTPQQIAEFYRQDRHRIVDPTHSEFFMLLAVKKSF